MNISVHNWKPLNWAVSDRRLPDTLRISEVVTYYRWNLVVNVEDVVTKEEYSLNIPIIHMEEGPDLEEEDIYQAMGLAAAEEKESMLQACGNTPGELAASQKGIKVALYTGEISGLDRTHLERHLKVYNTVSLMEKVVGDLGCLRYTAREVEQKARDYIASRLLQIVIKVELSGVGHLQLDWDSLFLREDGSFFLGNFGSGAPFGEEISPLRGSVALQQEPAVMSHYAHSSAFVAEAKVNMWGLGILLYQLYTGYDHPYGVVEGLDWAEQAASLSKQLLDSRKRSQDLIPQLEASKVPKRWAQLIVRLLEPRRMHRIGGFQILQEFPDLLDNHAD
ncbi:uncharacterized protein EMH_0076540 [Eimeria mitis]|uniref:Protein kinase domain-containing protein n=1 Tax=Eimeria mitis TaxID=44415 RepID=U6K4G3_9EIME|nr:uncharacterized protein EMH_0076540 [Eimeria mitis]CDJ32625.1 hypothetical protein EMH_0076540 [Eimeria mitis]